MNSLSAAWRAVQDHRKVFTIAENKQCSTQKSSVQQIGDLAALLPAFREVDENEDQVRKTIEQCARTRHNKLESGLVMCDALASDA